MAIINLSIRERYVFIVSVVFIIIALLYNFIFEPGLKKWRILDNEIDAKRAVLNRYFILLGEKDSIIKEYNRYAKATSNISKILSYMEGKADSLGIKTSNIKPGQAIEKEFYRGYDIELQIEGELEDIIKFLSEIIKFPNMVALKKFDFRLISQNPSVFKGIIVLSKIII